MIDDARAKQLLERHNKLKSDRGTWDAFRQEIGNYVMPRKAEIVSSTESPSTARQQVLFDSTAVNANNVLANGQLSWMTPHESRWCAFDAPAGLDRSERAKQWFKLCTEIALMELSRSSFYSEIHELYLDRGAFGTAAIFCEQGKKNTLRFEVWPCGTYSIAEDEEGYVDTVSRDFELTTRQAVQRFGKEALSDKMRAEANDPDGKKQDSKHWFVHMIFPRDLGEIDPEKADALNMPIASIYLDAESKIIVQESGFREQPFFVTRFLKWGTTPYGWSPSWIALPEARQLNFLEKNLDALAEIAAFPRILVPEGFQGAIDLRAHGVTYFNAAAMGGAEPKEWLTGGRYDVGKDRSEQKRKAINDAFHVDLFQMFAQLEKQMTATEVSERSAEKLMQFSPTFARMTTELFNPLLQRIFALLLRAGVLPPIPQDVVLQDVSGPFVPEPKISYTSRIAMSIKALENNSFNRAFGLIMQTAQVDPTVLDYINFSRAIPAMMRNEGVPADWTSTPEEVEEIKARRAQAQQAQAQAEQTQMMADAAGKAGKIDPNSALGRAMEAA